MKHLAYLFIGWLEPRKVVENLEHNTVDHTKIG